MPFSFKTCSIPGLFIIEPRIFTDERGFFLETYKKSDFAAQGIAEPFVQDNHSNSSRGTLRGLHFQSEPYAQGKLIRATRGKIWDVAVDIRTTSQTFGKWFGLELSAENHLMLWIPAGFAHGFVALEDGTEIQYKCTKEYNAESDGGIRWDDPDLNISWPFKDVLVSSKDKTLPLLKDLFRGKR